LIDYIAAVLSIIGAYFVAQKTDYQRRTGFLIWVISNIIWVITGLMTMQYSIVITFGFYLIFNVIGFTNNREIKKEDL